MTVGECNAVCDHWTNVYRENKMYYVYDVPVP